MLTMEFEANIDKNGVVGLPQEYRDAYGCQARFIFTIPDRGSADVEMINPMR
ncbi:MAG: hypothetical protein BECKG1743D_GA0114223_108782 [Candidatus Kentron sp. G]|nr:MAG: hypothetical protein BECKG1743F_GA0114225_106721 [Candidatus Kentron sp. G]VFN05969.1 MAG: hypothetical protein BECKG1743E_GA0114224_109461 [Candidatus Kentron sp. G]VFN06531.1 MAG: hypothetical protein BECKG1743D_GA0114223_108782 [Candidatus Kentron sp. G]